MKCETCEYGEKEYMDMGGGIIISKRRITCKNKKSEFYNKKKNISELQNSPDCKNYQPEIKRKVPDDFPKFLNLDIARDEEEEEDEYKI